MTPQVMADDAWFLLKQCIIFIELRRLRVWFMSVLNCVDMCGMFAHDMGLLTCSEPQSNVFEIQKKTLNLKSPEVSCRQNNTFVTPLYLTKKTDTDCE